MIEQTIFHLDGHCIVYQNVERLCRREGCSLRHGDLLEGVYRSTSTQPIPDIQEHEVKKIPQSKLTNPVAVTGALLFNGNVTVVYMCFVFYKLL